MSKIWLPGGGGGGAGSDECTLVKANVPKELTAITADSDDEAVRGTLDVETTLADSQALAGQTFLKFNPVTKLFERHEGGMLNKGAWTSRVGVNGKVAIPAGYHNGAGYVDQSIANRGAWTGRIGVNGKAAIPEGYHNGSGYVDQAITNRGAWTSSVAMNGKVAIPEGYHNGAGYINGPAITNRGAYGGTGNSRGNDASGQRMWVRVPGGYYSENANVYLSWADIRSMAGLTADKLKKGQSIMGIIGSWEGYTTSPLYLYKQGTWSNLQTTGITYIKGKYTISDYYFEASTNSYESPGILRLNQVVNLSAYHYLKADIRVVSANSNTGSWYGGIGISTSPSIESVNNFNAKAQTVNRTVFDGTIILDVSSFTGNYYIYVWAYTSGGYDAYTSAETIFLSNT